MSRYEFNKITDQRKAAFKRLQDAISLLGKRDENNWEKKRGPHARGAMYIAGYAIECKLKAIAMEVNRCRNLVELQEKWDAREQDVYDHGLEALAKRLPLYNRFRQSPVWRDFAGQVNRWRPAWRYDPQDHPNAAAAAFVQAIHAVYNWLESNQ